MYFPQNYASQNYSHSPHHYEQLPQYYPPNFNPYLPQHQHSQQYPQHSFYPQQPLTNLPTRPENHIPMYNTLSSMSQIPQTNNFSTLNNLVYNQYLKKQAEYNLNSQFSYQ